MKNSRLRHFLGAGFALIGAAALLATRSSAAGTESVLYNFTGGNDGGNAATSLVFDSAGNAYGTTVVGGAFGCGTVFKLKPTSGGPWLEHVLWNFSCGGDGKNPHGGVTLDAMGNIFGTTVAGGASFCTGDGCGVAFELKPNGSSINIMHFFRGGADGFGPGGVLVFDRTGKLYGETPDGGTHAQGTIFQLTPVGGHWTHTVIHNFTGGSDGATGSLGALLVDASGSLFGVTEVGGRHSVGTVFKVSPGTGGTWTFTTLYTFKGQPDGAFPYGGLTPDVAGNLYGTTYYGGANGMGTLYELSPSATGRWTEHVMYSFAGGVDGSLPTSTLVFDRDADVLYGTTTTGGRPSCDCGTLFKFGLNSHVEKIVHRFGVAPDGSAPLYGLTPNSGNLYGSTLVGGLYGQGAIFQQKP